MPEAEKFKYKFNNKELQDELDLNWYDYGARNYDAALGRFMNLDPLAKERVWVSPYNYVQGNPLSRIDPDGMLDWEPVKGLKNVWKAQIGDNEKSLAEDAGISVEEAEKATAQHPYITEGTAVAIGEIGVVYDENNLDKDAVISSRHVEQTSSKTKETKATILKNDFKFGKGGGKMSFFEGSYKKKGNVGASSSGFSTSLLTGELHYKLKNIKNLKVGGGASVYNLTGNANISNSLNIHVGLSVGCEYGLVVHSNKNDYGFDISYGLFQVGFDKSKK